MADQDRQQDREIAKLDRRISTVEDQISGRNGSIYKRIGDIEIAQRRGTCPTAEKLTEHIQEHKELKTDMTEHKELRILIGANIITVVGIIATVVLQLIL